MVGGGTRSEREGEGEQAGIVQHAADSDVRARVWELHLRGVTKARIGEMVGLHRNTVARYLAAMYRELGAERKGMMERKLLGAVARMRRVQEQAWLNHDADDERERAVLFGEAVKRGARYQSQRCQYLRVILEAEKEIARLEGLYEALGDDGGEVVFRIVRVSEAQEAEATNRDQARGGGFSPSTSSPL